jgi:hypothetical protein
MQLSGSGGLLHLENPGAASVPDLCPVQGRVRNVEGQPGTIVDEGAACRLTRVNLEYTSRKQKEDLCSVNAAGD